MWSALSHFSLFISITKKVTILSQVGLKSHLNELNFCQKSFQGSTMFTILANRGYLAFWHHVSVLLISTHMYAICSHATVRTGWVALMFFSHL